MTSFCDLNCSIRVSSCFSFATSFLLALQLLALAVEILQLLLDSGLSLECLPRQVLPARGDGLPCLGIELDHVLLELLGLELQPLFGRHDVRDTSLDVLQRLQLLLVRVVEGFLRVLGAVQQGADLRPDDLAGP